MLEEIFRLFEGLIRNIEGRSGRTIRLWYYRKRLGRCGENVTIDVGVVFQNPKEIFIGDNVWIDRQTILLAGRLVPGLRKFIDKPNDDYAGKAGELVLDSGVHVAPFTLLQAHAGLSIGKNVTVASGAKIYTVSHHYRNLLNKSDTKRYSFSSMAPAENQFLILSPVVIGDNAAIGLNSVVLPGTTVREGAWIGVLTHVPPGQTEPNAVYSSVKKGGSSFNENIVSDDGML